MNLDELLELIQTYKKLYVIQVHERDIEDFTNEENYKIDRLYELKEYNKIDIIKNIYKVNEYTIDGLFIPKEDNKSSIIIFKEFNEEEFILDEYSIPFSISTNLLFSWAFTSKNEAEEIAFKLTQAQHILWI